MKLPDLLKTVSNLEVVQGVERDLRGRQQVGVAAGIGTAIVQVVLAVAKEDYLATLGRFVANLATLDGYALHSSLERLDLYEMLGLLALVLGAGSFFVLRSTRFLMRESEEPFRYTFSVEPFAHVAGGVP